MITCKFEFTTNPAEHRPTSDAMIMKEIISTGNQFSCFIANYSAYI